jgi:hypothetical protein
MTSHARALIDGGGTSRQAGKLPATWTKLAYTRSYTLKYGMRAAKLTAVIDCIKAVWQEEPLPLP